MFGNLAKALFGSENDRVLKRLTPRVAAINALEPEIEALDDIALAAKTEEFRDPPGRRRTSTIFWRKLSRWSRSRQTHPGQRHFDVQLIGGMVLHMGRISEMKTGEGKTLVATCRLSQRPWRRRRACRHGERLSGSPRRRLDGPDL